MNKELEDLFNSDYIEIDSISADDITILYDDIENMASSNIIWTDTTGPLSNSPPYYSNYSFSDNIDSTLVAKGDLDVRGTLKVNGKDIGQVLETIEKRLAILTPDPAKLEKFEALKKAYDHYKLLESLCEIQETTQK